MLLVATFHSDGGTAAGILPFARARDALIVNIIPKDHEELARGRNSVGLAGVCVYAQREPDMAPATAAAVVPCSDRHGPCSRSLQRRGGASTSLELQSIMPPPGPIVYSTAQDRNGTK